MGYQLHMSLVCVMLASILHSHAQNAPQDFVDAHNAARKEVGLGPMKWDATVAQFAQNYANKRKADCALRHSNNHKYGENIAWGTGELSGVEAVRLWVEEKANYNYKANTCAIFKMCGHYTQVVWKTSVRLGCARVRCHNQAWFITCNYEPPGNYVGMKPY